MAQKTATELEISKVV